MKTKFFLILLSSGLLFASNSEAQLTKKTKTKTKNPMVRVEKISLSTNVKKEIAKVPMILGNERFDLNVVVKKTYFTKKNIVVNKVFANYNTAKEELKKYCGEKPTKYNWNLAVSTLPNGRGQYFNRRGSVLSGLLTPTSGHPVTPPKKLENVRFLIRFASHHSPRTKFKWSLIRPRVRTLQCR